MAAEEVDVHHRLEVAEGSSYSNGQAKMAVAITHLLLLVHHLL